MANLTELETLIIAVKIPTEPRNTYINWSYDSSNIRTDNQMNALVIADVPISRMIF